MLRSVEIHCNLRNFKEVSVVICLAASSLNVQKHVSVRERSSKGAAVGYWLSVLFFVLGHNHPFQQRLCHCDTFRSICINTYLFSSFLTYLLYLLTPWSRVLLEKPTGSQLVKKFPEFHGTRRFIPHSQDPATCPYPESHQCSPCPPSLPLPEDPS